MCSLRTYACADSWHAVLSSLAKVIAEDKRTMNRSNYAYLFLLCRHYKHDRLRNITASDGCTLLLVDIYSSTHQSSAGETVG